MAFASMHWNKAQQNYATIKNEILAIVLCSQNFNPIY